MNNLIKRVKRVAFGFKNFRNYRVRSLLYAGKPDWSLLPALTPPVICEVPVMRRLSGPNGGIGFKRNEHDWV